MSAASSKHPPEGKQTSIVVYKCKNYFFEKTRPLIENLRIKSLTCFIHQFNCCGISLWNFLPLVISLLSEWSIENTAVFPRKISAFGQKYILNKILCMRLVFQYKCINCTVDKNTGTDTCHTTDIYQLC